MTWTEAPAVPVSFPGIFLSEAKSICNALNGSLPLWTPNDAAIVINNTYRYNAIGITAWPFSTLSSPLVPTRTS